MATSETTAPIKEIIIETNPIHDFMKLLPVIIIAYILVDLWGKVISSLVYGPLGFKEDSPSHAFVVAIIVTFLLFLYLVLSNDTAKKLQTSMLGVQPMPTSL